MISPAHLIPKDDVMDIQQLPLDEHNHTTKISIDVDKGGSSNTETPSSSIPVASAPAMISSVIETELSPILQHEQDLQLHQHQPTEQRVTTMEDQLLDIPINTPDAVSSTNTPGLDTPCDTPSDTPMQRTINVVTYNNDLLANSPQQEDPIPVPENINDVNDTN
ncbi:hypothetical protein BC941DRAFT_414803 [Chlamydoabsidia padenii]|nr:hypothetical protein BC941DRAFT_414803 [Chlamydoabsidia padenii]